MYFYYSNNQRRNNYRNNVLSIIVIGATFYYFNRCYCVNRIASDTLNFTYNVIELSLMLPLKIVELTLMSVRPLFILHL